MLKALTFLSILILLSANTFAGENSELGFMQGRLRSSYIDGIGRAFIVGTGDRGIIQLSRDQNRCEFGLCTLYAYPGDFSNALATFSEVSRSGSRVIYKVIFLEPSAVEVRAGRNPKYSEVLQAHDIELEVNFTYDNWTFKQGNSISPKEVIMRIKGTEKPAEYLLVIDKDNY